MSFISEDAFLLAISTIAVLVLVSGLACGKVQVRGGILVPSLRSEPDQVQGPGAWNHVYPHALALLITMVMRKSLAGARGLACTG